MPGEPDALYLAARSVLLDALEALGSQREAIILVGAQAIYMYTGAYELPVAEYTTDADVTLDPGLLRQTPEIEAALMKAGFFRWRRVGAWAKTKDVNGNAVNVELDLMVPEAVGGPGRRAARLPGHAKEIARKARGLEAALVDKKIMSLRALDASDSRVFAVAVAGPSALLVSKLHKIQERLSEHKRSRLDDKDALDILRLLQTISTPDFVRTLRQLLGDVITSEVTREALVSLGELFADAKSPGAQMAARAAGPLAVPEQISASCAILATDLLKAML